MHILFATQKALQEARCFFDDGSLSEGMTLRPPDPPVEDEQPDSEPAGSQLTGTHQVSADYMYSVCVCVCVRACMCVLGA